MQAITKERLIELREILEDNGWIIECESPFEIRHEDGSTGQAANIVLYFLKPEEDE